jgi:hypothetical protein
VRGETFECDQTPRDIIRAFIREKVSHQMTAALRKNAFPSFPEPVSLKRIDLIAVHHRQTTRIVCRLPLATGLRNEALAFWTFGVVIPNNKRGFPKPTDDAMLFLKNRKKTY